MDGATVTLGNAIKLIRTARHITQRKLAKQLKVSANYLSLIESDKRDPSLAFLNRLAAQLGVPVAMLFVFQGEPLPGVQVSDLDKLREMLLRIDHMVVENTGRSPG
ncbi:MAG: helix-turn-helix transcriptional regulator [Terriglobales bacterium]